MYARVIVDINASALDKVFDYRIPEGMELTAGWRVKIPFGQRTTEGYILSLSETTSVDPGKIRDIIEPLEDYPAILPHLLKLAEEICERFHCTMSTALRLMIPAQMRGNKVHVKTETAVRCALQKEELIRYQENVGKRAVRKKILLSYLSDGEEHSLKDIRAVVHDPKPLLDELQKDGVIDVYQRELKRAPLVYPLSGNEHTLSEEQEEVLGELLSALQSCSGQKPGPDRRCFILHGVTGSGKTEVYMRLAQACLEQGKSVIVLVPEIALTAQMVSWFEGRFGSLAAVLHSRLTAGERFDEWRRIRRGEARVVIGARSAVFAPVERLGAIIVDEEHEPSFFSESFPQYDAREIALCRAKNENAILLLGSATPSIYSFAMARKGEYVLLEMPHRINGKPLPEVHIADMRRELSMGNRSIFSVVLQEELQKTLQAGQQAILFLNRRGYAASVTCRSCGTTIKCPHCDVSMAYHKSDGLLHCHYCGTEMPPPVRCPNCGSSSIRSVGIGTQRVEEELHRLFPGVKTLRMDSDTTRGQNAHQEMINAFRAREAQVLIGTQMIAKGLDFPQVSLVGAILADLSLNMPDYRAAERTFQLLVQVAGRAGRAEVPGKVIIQTYQPDHYAVASSVTQDYRQFFENEFSRRRSQLYPPFTVIARFLVEAKDGMIAKEEANKLAEQTKAYFAEKKITKRLLFIRSDEAPISYIDNRFRAQVLMKLLKHPDSDRALADLSAWCSQNEGGTTVSFEINPASLA